jgi:hypothetical protein
MPSMKLVCCSASVAVLVLSLQLRAAETTQVSRKHAGTSVTLSLLASFQPADGTWIGDPYLDNGLAGIEPGLALSVEQRWENHAVLALALSSSTSMKVSQTGRLVPRNAGAPCGPFMESECGPIETSHRDTLLSALGGFAGAVEAKAGLALIFGGVRQGPLAAEDIAGHWALTVEIGAAQRVSNRVSLVSSVQYYRVWRGENADELGLGRNIVRVAVGLRWRANH